MGGIIIIILILSVIYTNTQNQQSTLKPIPKYSALNIEIYDSPIKTQVVLKVSVLEEATEDRLRALLLKLFSRLKKKRGFHYRKFPNNIFIFVYASKETARTNAGQWIAMLEKPVDDTEPLIDIPERNTLAFPPKKIQDA